jgi:GntR family transcriptional regulator/MocR family aminotransferase
MLEQAALAEFMRSGRFERHIKRMRKVYAGRRDALLSALHDELSDVATIGPHHSGLNVLVSLDIPLSEDDVVARAARAEIGLRGASPAYTIPPPHPTFLVGFGGMAEDDIREGIRRLAQVL